jgi:hypothetical protein
METDPVSETLCFLFVEIQTMDKVQKLSSSECYTPSSEPFRKQNNLYQPLANLSKYQKGIYYLGTKVYNNLPQNIRDTTEDIKGFEAKLKQFLHLHSFYSLQEYSCYKSLLKH